MRPVHERDDAAAVGAARDLGVERRDDLHHLAAPGRDLLGDAVESDLRGVARRDAEAEPGGDVELELVEAADASGEREPSERFVVVGAEGRCEWHEAFGEF